MYLRGVESLLLGGCEVAPPLVIQLLFFQGGAAALGVVLRLNPFS